MHFPMLKNLVSCYRIPLVSCLVSNRWTYTLRRGLTQKSRVWLDLGLEHFFSRARTPFTQSKSPRFGQTESLYNRTSVQVLSEIFRLLNYQIWKSFRNLSIQGWSTCISSSFPSSFRIYFALSNSLCWSSKYLYKF